MLYRGVHVDCITTQPNNRGLHRAQTLFQLYLAWIKSLFSRGTVHDWSSAATIFGAGACRDRAGRDVHGRSSPQEHAACGGASEICAPTNQHPVHCPYRGWCSPFQRQYHSNPVAAILGGALQTLWRCYSRASLALCSGCVFRTAASSPRRCLPAWQAGRQGEAIAPLHLK